MLGISGPRNAPSETSSDSRTVPSDPLVGHIWKLIFFLGKMVLESAGASYLVALVAFAVNVGLIVVLGDHRWMDAVWIGPTFLMPAACAVAFAYLRRNYLSSCSYFAWVVPGLAFARGYLEVTRGSGDLPVWDTLFGSKCGSSECLYEAFFTVPLACGVVYSLASGWIQLKKTAMQA